MPSPFILDWNIPARGPTGSQQEDYLGTRTSAAAAIFRHLVRSLLSAPSSKKPVLQKMATDRLLDSTEQYAYVDELLDLCAAATENDRLDVGIDVMSATGELVLSYGWACLIRDLQKWSPYSRRAYEPNDDCWYVILRSVARCNAPEEARLRFISACSSASQRGVMEGIVEALGDLAGVGARIVLNRIASHHDDLFVRERAAEVLGDLE